MQKICVAMIKGKGALKKDSSRRLFFTTKRFLYVMSYEIINREREMKHLRERHTYIETAKYLK